MERYKKQIPEGVQDTLPLECYHKRRLEEQVMAVLKAAGYDEVETPSFEYYDVFADGIGAVRQEKLQKFFDAKGRILVLRPDITMPIARLAATRLYQGEPLRLCYKGSAFGTDGSFYAEQKEFTQTGVECLGVKGPEADAALIALSLEALRAAGLPDTLIELGQVEFFKGLMEEAGVNKEDADILRSYIDEKNLLGTELCLKRLGVPKAFAKRILRLTNLYGGPEVFEEAMAFSNNPRCQAAVNDLRTIYETLCDFGFGENISIDLGMLQSMDYYSGMVFKGVSAGIGQPVLSGGRYDHLVSQFGKDIPATGFCMNIKRMLVALDKKDALHGGPHIDAVVSGPEGCRAEAYRQVNALRGKGLRAVLALTLEQQALEEYAARLNAKAVWVEG